VFYLFLRELFVRIRAFYLFLRELFIRIRAFYLFPRQVICVYVAVLF